MSYITVTFMSLFIVAFVSLTPRVFITPDTLTWNFVFQLSFPLWTFMSQDVLTSESFF